MSNIKKVLLLALCACLVVGMATCGKKEEAASGVSAADGFKKVGLEPLKSGELYEEISEIEKMDLSNELNAKVYVGENHIVYRFIFDTEQECADAATSYVDDMKSKGWERHDTDFSFISPDKDAVVWVQSGGPLGEVDESWKGSDFEDKYLVAVSIYYNE